MTTETIRAKLASLEQEIRLLKDMVAKKKPTVVISKRGLSSLEGLWKGKSDFSLEEIRGSEIKLEVM